MPGGPRANPPLGERSDDRFCCAMMTVPLRFCDAMQAPAAPRASWSPPAQPQGRAGLSLVLPIAPSPNPGPPGNLAATGLTSVGTWRLLAVVAPHLAALAVVLQTETDFGSRTGFLLSWGILNFFWIALLRRPALSGALSLTLVVVLVLLSRLKHDNSTSTTTRVSDSAPDSAGRRSSANPEKFRIPRTREARSRSRFRSSDGQRSQMLTHARATARSTEGEAPGSAIRVEAWIWRGRDRQDET